MVSSCMSLVHSVCCFITVYNLTYVLMYSCRLVKLPVVKVGLWMPFSTKYNICSIFLVTEVISNGHMNCELLDALCECLSFERIYHTAWHIAITVLYTLQISVVMEGILHGVTEVTHEP